jgi:hypothetical protein
LLMIELRALARLVVAAEGPTKKMKMRDSLEIWR